jgi:hypothetical protein
VTWLITIFEKQNRILSKIFGLTGDELKEEREETA